VKPYAFDYSYWLLAAVAVLLLFLILRPDRYEQDFVRKCQIAGGHPITTGRPSQWVCLSRAAEINP
jgi:hypothetical protein